VTGAIGGAVSFVVGYLLTLLVVAVIEAEDSSENLAEFAGHLYYNAQFVAVESSVDGGGVGFGAQMSEVNYLTDGGASQTFDAPVILYHLIPVLVLFVGGYAIARSADARELQEGAIAGATVALGAVVLALVGTFVFSFNSGGVTTSPVLVEGVLLAGIVFPGLLGAAGGAVSTQVGSSQQQFGRR
jgi:hypothetical protein